MVDHLAITNFSKTLNYIYLNQDCLKPDASFTKSSEPISTILTRKIIADPVFKNLKIKKITNNNLLKFQIPQIYFKCMEYAVNKNEVAEFNPGSYFNAAINDAFNDHISLPRLDSRIYGPIITKLENTINTFIDSDEYRLLKVLTVKQNLLSEHYPTLIETAKSKNCFLEISISSLINSFPNNFDKSIDSTFLASFIDTYKVFLEIENILQPENIEANMLPIYQKNLIKNSTYFNLLVCNLPESQKIVNYFSFLNFNFNSLKKYYMNIASNGRIPSFVSNMISVLHNPEMIEDIDRCSFENFKDSLLIFNGKDEDASRDMEPQKIQKYCYKQQPFDGVHGNPVDNDTTLTALFGDYKAKVVDPIVASAVELRATRTTSPHVMPMAVELPEDQLSPLFSGPDPIPASVAAPTPPPRPQLTLEVSADPTPRPTLYIEV